MDNKNPKHAVNYQPPAGTHRSKLARVRRYPNNKGEPMILMEFHIINLKPDDEGEVYGVCRRYRLDKPVNFVNDINAWGPIGQEKVYAQKDQIPVEDFIGKEADLKISITTPYDNEKVFRSVNKIRPPGTMIKEVEGQWEIEPMYRE